MQLKQVLLIVFFSVTISLVSAQEVIKLWEGKAKGSEDWEQTEIKIKAPYGEIIQNVVDPTLTVFHPDKSIQTQTAVIICPGGGFRSLSWESEGVAAAEWLNSKGITAFILKYRILDTTPSAKEQDKSPKMPPKIFNSPEEVIYANVNPAPGNKTLTKVINLAIDDAQQALKIVRENAGKWDIDPAKVGFLGFSAGGGVVIGAGTKVENTPNFIATAYGPALTDVINPRNAPPLFMAVAADHKNVATGCRALYTIWRSAGNSAELHLYGKGSGPFGMGNKDLPSGYWPEQFYRWLKSEGF